MQKQIVFFIGSPKKNVSASECLGKYLLKSIGNQARYARRIYINDLIASRAMQHEVLSFMNTSDIIILSSPIYVDSPPSSVIKFMEIVADYRKKIKNVKKQRFFVISNCGYPEAENNNVAIKIYQKFVFEANFEWAGYMTFGMGLVYQYNRIEIISAIFKRIRKAFEIAANALANDNLVPIEINDNITKPFIPSWAYIFSLTLGIIFIGARNGVWNLRKECQ